VPILREARLASEDARLDVVSLEIWTDHFSFRYVIQGDPQVLEVFIGCAWEVWDDVGTPYRSTSGGARGLEDWSDGTQDFAPAPPDAATTLTFSAREIPRATELARVSVNLA